MKLVTILCPNCHQEVSISEAVSHQIEEDIEKKIALKYEKQQMEIQSKWEHEQKEKMWMKAQEEAFKKVKEENQKELKILKEEAELKDKELAKAQEAELEFRKKAAQLESDKKTLKLEIQRQIDAEKEGIIKKVEAEEFQKYKLREAELQKKLDDAQKTAQELQQRVNQTSQQLQGEVMELALEEALRSEFPLDEVSAVGKGINGADLIHKVRNKNGVVCGTIVWESKRTKNWDKTWSIKLKDDMLRVKGDHAILVTQVLPDDMKNFGFRDGIYIASFENYISLAFVLRRTLIEQQIIKSGFVGKNEKMEVVYNYIMSSEFRQRIEAIAEAFTSMKSDLDAEKRVFAKIWAKREKEIERVIHNTVTMHGDLQGLIGSSMPEVEMLDLENLVEDTQLKVKGSEPVEAEITEEIRSQRVLFEEEIDKSID